MKNEPVTIFKYKNKEVPIFFDEQGQQYYCYLDNTFLGFGTLNNDFEEDLKYLIDDTLDLIYTFSGDLIGGELRWIINGRYRDIGVMYRKRLLKVFCIGKDDPEFTDLPECMRDHIMQTANKVLTDYLLAEAFFAQNNCIKHEQNQLLN